MTINSSTRCMLGHLEMALRDVEPEFRGFKTLPLGNPTEVDTLTAVYTFGEEVINVAMDSPSAALRDIMKQFHW
jgi:hypothetical protein